MAIPSDSPLLASTRQGTAHAVDALIVTVVARRALSATFFVIIIIIIVIIGDVLERVAMIGRSLELNGPARWVIRSKTRLASSTRLRIDLMGPETRSRT